MNDAETIKNSLGSHKYKVGIIGGPFSFFLIVFISFFLQLEAIESNNFDLKFIANSLFPFIALGTMIWMMIWWITECVPMGLTGLIAPFIFIIAGILTASEALQKFSDPIIWIFISGFVLAAAFKKTGLDERIAYRLATFYKGNNPKIAIFFVACLPVFVLSMTGSITASTTIVFPLLLAFIKLAEDNSNDSNKIKSDKNSESTNYSSSINKNDRDVRSIDSHKNLNDHGQDNYTEASFLSLGQAATAGAMLLLISTAPNLIAKSTVEDFVPGNTISFTDWFIIGAPHAIIGLFISWNVVFLLLRPNMKKIALSSTSRFKDKLKLLGKIKKEEKIVLAILVSALLLWIIPSLMRSLIPENIDMDPNMSIGSVILIKFSDSIPISIPALFIILAVGLVKIKNDVKVKRKTYDPHLENKQEHQLSKKKKLVHPDSNSTPRIIENTEVVSTPILSWTEMLKAVDWNIIFLFGGGLVLGLGIENSGLASMMGNQISNIAGSHFTELSIFALSVILGYILSYAASNTASAVIACPLAASLAIGSGFDPIPPIVAAALGASISSAIPSATPPMAIIYSSKRVSILNMFKTGMTSDLLRIIALILLGPILIQIIL